MQFQKAGAHYAFQGCYPSSGRLTRPILHCINLYLNAIVCFHEICRIWQYCSIKLRVEIFGQSQEVTSKYSLIADQLYRGRRRWSDLCNFYLSSMYSYLRSVNWCNFEEAGAHCAFQRCYPSSGRLTRLILHCINLYGNAIVCFHFLSHLTILFN